MCLFLTGKQDDNVLYLVNAFILILNKLSHLQLFNILQFLHICFLFYDTQEPLVECMNSPRRVPKVTPVRQKPARVKAALPAARPKYGRVQMPDKESSPAKKMKYTHAAKPGKNTATKTDANQKSDNPEDCQIQ